jgi:cytochrome c peroxidase
MHRNAIRMQTMLAVKPIIIAVTIAVLATCSSSKSHQSASTGSASGSSTPVIDHVAEPGDKITELPPAPPVPGKPLGLPELPATTLAVTANGVTFGEKLFSDPRLSATGKVSCVTCHDPAAAFAGNSFSNAADGKRNARMAPALVNLAWRQNFGWDGRYQDMASLLRAHIKGQLGKSIAEFTAAINAVSEYSPHVARTFGNAQLTASEDNVISALSQFVTTRYGGNSAWDQAERSANVSEDLKLGYQLFTKQARCATCHVPPLYTDNQFHRIGLIASPDQGRGAVDPSQAGAFRTPSLRALGNRSKLFHDGSAFAIGETTATTIAIDWHLQGGTGQGADRSIIDPALVPVTLTAVEQASLHRFVRSLQSPATGAPQ